MVKDEFQGADRVLPDRGHEFEEAQELAVLVEREGELGVEDRFGFEVELLVDEEEAGVWFWETEGGAVGLLVGLGLVADGDAHDHVAELTGELEEAEAVYCPPFLVELVVEVGGDV